MKISAVIPLYNKKPHIGRAIHSILNQETPVDEIIVVDDGSTDGSAQEVEKFTASDLILIKQPNQGAAVARNRGVEETSGKYIAFLDADDEWKPDFITRIEKLIRAYPNCGAYTTSTEDRYSDGTSHYPVIYNFESETWPGIIPNIFEMFQHSYPFNQSSIVIPRLVLDEIGGFPKGVINSEDVAVWIKIGIKYPIAFDSSRATIYHKDATWRVTQVYRPLEEFHFNIIIKEAIKKGEMPQPLVEEAVNFMVIWQLRVAIENLKKSNRKKAIQLLDACKPGTKYRIDWLYWRIRAAMPPKWVDFAVKINLFSEINQT